MVECVFNSVIAHFIDQRGLPSMTRPHAIDTASSKLSCRSRYLSSRIHAPFQRASALTGHPSLITTPSINRSACEAFAKIGSGCKSGAEFCAIAEGTATLEEDDKIHDRFPHIKKA